MHFRPNPSSGVPLYLQLIERVKHGVETGALRPGEQLPAIRKMAEDLVINANTVAKAYRELEHAGVIELRQGSGAFVAAGAGRNDGGRLKNAVPIVAGAVAQLRSMGLTEDEIRRMVEAELSALRESAGRR